MNTALSRTSAASTTEPAYLNPAFLNIAAYKFVPLDSLAARRAELKKHCDRLGLRGTILLSPEGINIFLAGEQASVRSFLETLRQDAAFSDIAVKESLSEKLPFRRMLVRLKKEIISFGIDSVRPGERTSPKMSPVELKQWLDEGRSVRLLDTRNDYEVDLGTFAGAEHFSIGHFREFPAAIQQLPDEAKRQPIVMFCTGGIRCEKAGPLMEQAGFEQVYQLDGGILKYFEECGGAHFDGSCFVFDGRVALDPQLQPTGNLLCFACQAVLTPEEITSDKFLFGQHCPRCYVPPDAQRQLQFQARQQQIIDLAAAQPGCQPYDNLRKIHVPGRFAGWALIDFLDAYQPAIGRSRWQEWLGAGQISRGNSPAYAALVVKEGQCFEQHMPGTTEPNINPNIQLLHEDDSLVVVNKPAPLPTHPSGRFNKNTLLHLLGLAYPKEKLRVAHRLDSHTTGLVVLCRKHQSAKYIQPQFANHQVQKLYLARVQGHPSWETIKCEARISAEPIRPGGLRGVCDTGLPAQTEFKVIHRLPDGTSLLEAMPVTGRTHQIRIHLWHLGHAVVGDPLYRHDSKLAQESPAARRYSPEHHAAEDFPQKEVSTLETARPVMCLHAARLTVKHPETRQPITFQADCPAWATRP